MDEALDQFRSWFESNGGFIHEAIDFECSPERGISVVVNKKFSGPLPRGTGIIRCPHALSLSSLNATDTSSDKHVPLPSEIIEKAGPRFIGALVLCIQWLLNDTSPWYLYIRLLPGPPQSGVGRHFTEVDTPLWWPNKDLEWLNDTNVRRGIDDLEASWKLLWDLWSPTVIPWAESNGLSGLDWRLYKWAMTIFGSRSFSSRVLRKAESQAILNDDPHSLLYPGIDFLNHSPFTSNRWSSAESSLDDLPSRFFGIVCNDESTSGDEVWNNYGTPSNDQLLLSWGFVIDDNPDDTYSLQLRPSAPNSLLQRLVSQQTKVVAQDMPATGMTAASENGQKRTSPFNVDQNIYLIRRRDAAVHPDYPSPSNYWDSHFAGFPTHLLSRLAAEKANDRETQAFHDQATDCSISDAYRYFGRKAQLSVTYLLFQKLSMTLKTLRSTTPIRPNNLSEKRSIHWEQSRSYRAGQLQIVESNYANVALQLELAKKYRIDWESKEPPLKEHALPTLAMLPALLNHMRRTHTATFEEFIAGFAEADVDGIVDIIREQIAEDMYMALSIGALAILDELKVDSDMADLSQILSFYLEIAKRADQPHGQLTEQEIGDLEDITESVAALEEYIAAVRRYAPRSTLWRSGKWDALAFRRAIILMAYHETDEIIIGAGSRTQLVPALFTGPL